ncbi:adenylate/guanylate cyclase domain-containing protein, partial [Rhizobiaceae sp. 2RAB30]
MKKSDLADIVLWLSQQGYRGADEASLVQGFSERCNAIGLGISRSMVLIDTLHPDFEGRAFLW